MVYVYTFYTEFEKKGDTCGLNLRFYFVCFLSLFHVLKIFLMTTNKFLTLTIYIYTYICLYIHMYIYIIFNICLVFKIVYFIKFSSISPTEKKIVWSSKYLVTQSVYVVSNAKRWIDSMVYLVVGTPLSSHKKALILSDRRHFWMANLSYTVNTNVYFSVDKWWNYFLCLNKINIHK